MPRGYLKNAKLEGRKRTRGGGSIRGSCSGISRKEKQRGACGQKGGSIWLYDPNLDLYDDEEALDCGESESITDTNAKIQMSNSARVSPTTSKGRAMDCPICFETRPVISLMKGCSWHDSACYDCLRQIYVTRAQTSARNYPLKCFHPQCQLKIREGQLLKYGLIRSDKELKNYFHMSELAKGNIDGASSVYCPYCDHPRAFKENTSSGQSVKVNNRAFSCRQCHKNFMVSPFRDIIQAMENFGEDEAGPNEGWCQCPECKMLISKGYGDDDMACNCGAYFSFAQAQRQSGFIYPLARPVGDLDPTDVLYLYW
mmetsp:Transcript_12247/g.16019  ORF Transcript_12247/g.16019 Transcript_12247/m.16019 type:complete len:313 (+) Transcript_12247:28-966(+)